MLQISDIDTPYWGNEPRQRVEARREEYLCEGGRAESIFACDIRDNLAEINLVADEFIAVGSRSIIIDITSLPKKFFFVLTRRILERSKAETIIATYTRPARYDRSRPLARDAGPWLALPGFEEPYPVPEKPYLIVGLGYEPLGLPQFLKQGEIAPSRVRLLFPFPSTPAGYLRNWEFVQNLDSEVMPDVHGSHQYAFEPVRVNGYDVSGIYDCIYSLTDSARENVIFAPYGTKPMSLSMCLFAIQNKSKAAVCYTQPSSYNPYYSSGIRYVGEFPETYAYCIRLEGKDMYSAPSS